MLWLNDKLMQHIKCYQKDLGKDISLNFVSHLYSFSTFCSQMVGQGHFASQSIFLVGIISPLLIEGQLLIIDLY